MPDMITMTFDTRETFTREDLDGDWKLTATRCLEERQHMKEGPVQKSNWRIKVEGDIFAEDLNDFIQELYDFGARIPRL